MDVGVTTVVKHLSGLAALGMSSMGSALSALPGHGFFRKVEPQWAEKTLLRLE